jgi:hypothetical protein
MFTHYDYGLYELEVANKLQGASGERARRKRKAREKTQDA